jgi:hypothetical protein
VKLTGVTSPTVATGLIQRALPPRLVNNGTTYWNEGAWSEFRGFPKSVAFYQNKAVFGGQKTTTVNYHPEEKLSSGNRFYGSKDSEFSNFDTGLGGSEDSFVYMLAAEKIDQIEWISSGDNLFIGASSGIFPYKNIKSDSVAGSRNLYEQVSRNIFPINNNGIFWYTDLFLLTLTEQTQLEFV